MLPTNGRRPGVPGPVQTYETLLTDTAAVTRRLPWMLETAPADDLRGPHAPAVAFSLARIIAFVRKKNSTRSMMAADMMAELSQNDCQVGK